MRARAPRRRRLLPEGRAPRAAFVRCPGPAARRREGGARAGKATPRGSRVCCRNRLWRCESWVSSVAGPERQEHGRPGGTSPSWRSRYRWGQGRLWKRPQETRTCIRDSLLPVPAVRLSRPSPMGNLLFLSHTKIKREPKQTSGNFPMRTAGMPPFWFICHLLNIWVYSLLRRPCVL